jgi:hypothetical protein
MMDLITQKKRLTRHAPLRLINVSHESLVRPKIIRATRYLIATVMKDIFAKFLQKLSKRHDILAFD